MQMKVAYLPFSILLYRQITMEMDAVLYNQTNEGPKINAIELRAKIAKENPRK